MKSKNSKELNKSRTKKNKKKKFNWKVFVSFILFMILFTGITGPFMLLYGPFEEAKRIFVGAAMGSMHYQWLATTLLSDEKIKEITGKGQSEGSSEEQDLSLINISKNKDESIEEITLEDNPKFKGYALIIHDPTRVKVGVSSQLYKEGETTTQIAVNSNAIAAVNGGAFTDAVGTQKWTSNGGIPVGILIAEGKNQNEGAGSGKWDVAAITKEGKLLVGPYTQDELLRANVTDALSFTPEGASPLLIINGKMTKVYGDGGIGTAPRTMIGQRKDGSIVLVVLDSKTIDGRVAATLKESQEVMYALNCVTATMLDGGKSVTMYYDGETINNPSNSLGERPIASAFIVK